MIESDSTPRTPRRKARWPYLLFALQFAVVLWPPLYNRTEPTFIGIPFFYWFQLLWILVSSGFTALVYFLTREP